MQRQQIGFIGALWRYPVKSMRGESLSTAVLTRHGLAGDRIWALRQTEYGGIVSARTLPAMLQMHASWVHDPFDGQSTDPLSNGAARVHIELPDGAVIVLDHSTAIADEASRALSTLLRREISLERVRRDPITSVEREAIMRG